MQIVEGSQNPTQWSHPCHPGSLWSLVVFSKCNCPIAPTMALEYPHPPHVYLDGRHEEDFLCNSLMQAIVKRGKRPHPLYFSPLPSLQCFQ